MSVFKESYSQVHDVTGAAREGPEHPWKGAWLKEPDALRSQLSVESAWPQELWIRRASNSPPPAQDALWSPGVNSGSAVIPFILLAQPESLLNLES